MRSTLFPLFATLAVHVLVAMAVVAVPVFAPVAANEIGVSAGYVGLFVALSYGGSMASSLMSSDLVKNFGAIRVSQFCLVLCAGGIALFSADSPRLAITLVCAAFDTTAIGWNGVFLSEVARQAPLGNPGDATGGALFFTYLGVLVGLPIFAMMVESGMSYPAAYVLIAVPALACGLWLLGQPSQPRGDIEGNQPKLQERP